MPLDPAANLTILCGDVIEQLRTLEDESVQCCVTSPPYYGLRSYLKGDNPLKALEIGAEETPDAYVARMVGVFREVRRVLRSDGCLWLNLGDSFANVGKWGGASGGKHAQGLHGNTGVGRNRRDYGGLKSKDLLMIPARVAMALQADGWYLRAACPWIKRNGMPESVKDRPAQTIETIFLLTKSDRYHYDSKAVKKPLAASSVPRLQQNIAGQVGTVRANGGAKTNGNFKAVGDIAAGRARRSSDWFFESWQGMLQDEDGDPLAFVVNTRPFRGAHFAVFPPNLIRPCIQSGTSAHGCCPSCGTPFERIMEKTAEVDTSAKGSRFDTGKTGGRDGGDRTQPGERFVTRQVGWNQSCDCATYDPVPCTVLDPFAGSGTTGQVALEEGCRAVLIELNPEYIPLIHQRCGLIGPEQSAA